MEVEAETLNYEVGAETQRKQQELGLRRNRKEKDFESQKEEIELAEMKRRKKLSPKMNKMEIREPTSSGDSVSSASGTSRLRAGRTSSWVTSQRINFGIPPEDINDDKPNIVEKNNQPCPSTQPDTKLKLFAVPKSTIASTEINLKKFDAKAFVPSSVALDAMKAAILKPAQLAQHTSLQHLHFFICVSAYETTQDGFGQNVWQSFGLAGMVWSVSSYY